VALAGADVRRDAEPGRPPPRLPGPRGLTLSRAHGVFAVLGAFFLTNALIAEVVGGKLIFVGPEWLTLAGSRLAASIGVVLWPVVFVTTDLINEYYGRRGVRFLSWLAAGMIGYAFVMLWITMRIPAASFSGIDDATYNRVFGQTNWIIVGSITAFLVSQLIDVTVFHLLRRKTGASMLWLRATGSTVVSQLIDSVIVLYIGIALPQGYDLPRFVSIAVPNYLIKLVVAVLMTPLIYGVHHLIDGYLGEEEARRLTEAAAGPSRGS
jgi:uncharacterized integral membrane protein (TIGR00697 family)